MTVHSSHSLTAEQHTFAKELVEAGHHSSLSAVLQQGVDLMWHRMDDENLERATLKALLSQLAAGAFVSGAQMEKFTARMIAERRRGQAGQN